MITLNGFPKQKKSDNKCVDAEKPAGSRVLLTQHPRPSRFSGHDRRSVEEKLKPT